MMLKPTAFGNTPVTSACEKGPSAVFAKSFIASLNASGEQTMYLSFDLTPLSLNASDKASNFALFKVSPVVSDAYANDDTPASNVEMIASSYALFIAPAIDSAYADLKSTLVFNASKSSMYSPVEYVSIVAVTDE